MPYEFTIEPDDPNVFRKIFRFVVSSKKEKKGALTPLALIITEEYGELSRRIDKSGIQEGVLVRNVFLARRLAEILINDKGELDLEALELSIKILKEHLYYLGPKLSSDGKFRKYVLFILERLLSDKNLQRQIKMINPPSANKIVDRLIRETVHLLPNETIEVKDVRRAVLSSLLVYLRQSVGSCFGTATAILVKKEHPELFLKDIDELLSTGKLKRTFGGVEYSVPLSPSMGGGDLRRPILATSENISDISSSPGLMRALEAALVIDSKLEIKKKIALSSKKIEKALLKIIERGNFTSAEEILSEILLNFCNISKKDLLEFERKAKAINSSILNSPFQIASSKSAKDELIKQYLIKLELAVSAFKNFADNPLLKSWEFTLASFAETKPSFTRWNMYASLGFNAEEKGGIGECLYQALQEKLTRSNRKVEALQEEYEVVYQQLKLIEGRMRNVSSEREAQWTRIEYESKRSEFRTLEEIRDKENYKGKRYANLLNDLLVSYDELFPKYFQEIYDPDMHEVTSSPYDDSPAGFRLLYKHGRAQTSMWTLIYSKDEFIEALSSFFSSSEIELIHDPHFEGLQEDVSDLVTKLISFIRTDEFMIGAFDRMARAHNSYPIKDPLNNLEKIDKKPWAYTSGGTMNNLVRCYFKQEKELKEVGRWVENEMELYVFIIDTIKQMPGKLLDEYTSEAAILNDLSLLSHSPTHAFRVIPSYNGLKTAVLHEGFTYTYVRDQFVQKPMQLIDYMFLDEEMMEKFLMRISSEVQHAFRGSLNDIIRGLSGRKNPQEFSNYLLDEIGKRKLQGISELLLAEKLYEWLPMTSVDELCNRMEKCVETLPGLSDSEKILLEENIQSIASSYRGKERYVFADQLQELILSAILLTVQRTTLPINYPLVVAKRLKELAYGMPYPLFFADTNWVNFDFAFAINPVTGKLSLWRFEETGCRGSPMLDWQEWLNGTRKDRTWALYPKPEEYRLL